MNEEDQSWMAYIDAEVKEVCKAKGWRHQVKRKWSVLAKLVSDSPIGDYEWKLILSCVVEDLENDDITEGVYYVLSFDRASCLFYFQHDTSRVGMQPYEEGVLSTYTTLSLPLPMSTDGLPQQMNFEEYVELACHPPAAGWLRDHLLRLTTRFGPNIFSAT